MLRFGFPVPVYSGVTFWFRRFCVVGSGVIIGTCMGKRSKPIAGFHVSNNLCFTFTRFAAILAQLFDSFLFFSEETLTVSMVLFDIAVAFGKSFRASSSSFWLPRRISLSDTLSSISINRVLRDSSSFCTKLKLAPVTLYICWHPASSQGWRLLHHVLARCPGHGPLHSTGYVAVSYHPAYQLISSGVAVLRISLNELSVSTMLESESAVFDC